MGTGIGKTRNEEMEMRNGRFKKWAFPFITVLHALFAFSNTFWSGPFILPQEIAERK